MARLRTAARLGLGVGAVCWYLDERGLIRPWRVVSHTLQNPPVNIQLRVKASPPPIGCMEWPGGRVLLEWAMDPTHGVPRHGATVLEIGSGCGVTAIGLLLAQKAQRETEEEPRQSKSNPTRVLATDVCAESLQNLTHNARMNGFQARSMVEASSEETGEQESAPGAEITIGEWDASGGSKAVKALQSQFGIHPSKITHVLGSDVVYHGGADPGLPATLACLFQANPSCSVTLLLVDRFSGAAVAAVSHVAGVQPNTPLTPQLDPALVQFQRRCQQHGLEVVEIPLDPAVKARVAARQSYAQRVRWALCGYWEGLLLYRVRPLPKQ